MPESRRGTPQAVSSRRSARAGAAAQRVLHVPPSKSGSPNPNHIPNRSNVSSLRARQLSRRASSRTRTSPRWSMTSSPGSPARRSRSPPSTSAIRRSPRGLHLGGRHDLRVHEVQTGRSLVRSVPAGPRRGQGCWSRIAAEWSQSQEEGTGNHGRSSRRVDEHVSHSYSLEEGARRDRPRRVPVGRADQRARLDRARQPRRRRCRDSAGEGPAGSVRLTAVSLSGHSDLVSDAGVAEFRKALNLARKLGITKITTSTGGHADTSSGSLDDQRAAFLERIGPLADEAAPDGIDICLETHGGLLATGEISKALIADIGRPNIGINYDPGNVIHYGDTRPETDLPGAVDKVTHMHVKDQIGGVGVWNFPQVGTGEVDFPPSSRRSTPLASTVPARSRSSSRASPGPRWPRSIAPWPSRTLRAAVRAGIAARDGAEGKTARVRPFQLNSIPPFARARPMSRPYGRDRAMVQVAVLGAGFMGSTHAKAYAAMPDVEVAAIYAPSPIAANRWRAEIGSRWTDDLEAVSPTPASTRSTSACPPRNTARWPRPRSPRANTSCSRSRSPFRSRMPRRWSTGRNDRSRLHDRARAALLAGVRRDRAAGGDRRAGQPAPDSPRAGSRSRPGRRCSAAPISPEER